MELFEAIFTRRSIRKYKKGMKIPQDYIRKMLEAAMYAPSSRNRQPWHFIVIDDQTTLTYLSEIHPYGKMLAEASLAILVCGDMEIEEMKVYHAINGSAATQNLLLAAHALGLGAVWLGVYGREERMKSIAQKLNLPDNIIPVSLISIGYPDEVIDIPQRFKPERIRYNKW